MILMHCVFQSSIFSFSCLFSCRTLERSETHAKVRLFTGYVRRQRLLTSSRVSVHIVLCVYSWRLVYSAQSLLSSIWCQPKRRAAITNEDRWEGAGASSCEHCNAYVRLCLHAPSYMCSIQSNTPPPSKKPSTYLVCCSHLDQRVTGSVFSLALMLQGQETVSH